MSITKPIRHFSALVFFCTVAYTACAQTFQWAHTFPSQSLGRSVVTSDSGFIYTTGKFSGTHDFDPGPGEAWLAANAYYDVFITKQKPNGDLVWARCMGGGADDAGHAIGVDAAGNVYVAGEYRMTAVFDPQESSSVVMSANSSSGDIFIAKLGAGGKLAWVKGIGGDLDQMVHDLAVTPGGNVVIAGEFRGTNVDFDPSGTATVNRSTHSGSVDGFFCQFTSAGAFSWVKVIGGENPDMCRGIDISDDGDIYLTGTFQGIVDFDPDANVAFITQAVGKQIFMGKYTSAGAYTWAVHLGGAGDDEGFSIKADTAGYVYGTGYFTGTADFNPGSDSLKLTSVGNRDIYICKLTPAGALSWARSIGGTNLDCGYSIEADDSGYVYTSGSFMTKADFDPGTDSVNISPVYRGVVNPDIFISKLNASGNYVWAGSMGGGGSDMAYGFTLLGSNADMFITGSYYDTIDYDPGPDIFKDFSSTAGINGFVVRIGNCSKPVLSGSITGSDTVCKGSDQAYSITATAGATSYGWTFPIGWSGTSATNSINVKAGASSGNIQVRAINACGMSAPVLLPVKVNPLPVVTLNLAAIDTQCWGVTNLVLSGGMPAGGVYSGTTVTGGSFSPLNAGPGAHVINYIYTDGNGCTDTAKASIHVVHCLGIDPPEHKGRIVAYPNPFKSSLTVQLLSATQLSLVNVLGEEAGHWELAAGEHTLELDHLPAGVYLLRGQDEQGTFAGKLIRE